MLGFVAQVCKRDDMDRMLYALEELQMSHLFLHVSPTHGRGCGGNAHDTVGAVHAIAKPAERDATKELLHALSHLMRHDGYGDETLHRSNSGFVEFLDKVLAPRCAEVQITPRLSFIVLPNALAKILFFAWLDSNNPLQ